ncbi:SulP family inorganic anion transporter [Spirulina subsalsa]|uniref:SulP family inorganic anion transporter n=1 Tax=Spirulina subsalsa TaxID=54311 RepID=UPI0002D7BD31|nr:SulP family inorganic anion transporter [Spirulina subsalsa]
MAVLFSWTEEFQPRNLLSSFLAGWVTGIIGVIRGISYAALIFSGSLAEHLNLGVGIAVYSTAAISIIVALMSSLPGMIATPLAAPTAVLAVLAAAIAQQMQNDPTEVMLLTVIAAIALGSLCTGLFLFLLGICQLGKVISIIPYPVVGGFMAGTGWLLVRGGVQVTCEHPLTWQELPSLLDWSILSHWGVGLVFALLLLWLTQRYRHYLIMPGTLISAIALFYLTLLLTHTPLDLARTQGWLLGPFPAGGLWHPLTFSQLPTIHWGLLGQQWGTVATLMFISLVSLVLTNSGIELAVEREIDLNQELQAVGMANIAAGLGGGMAGNQALPSTILVHKMSAAHRLAGVFKTIPCATVLILGAHFLEFFPKPILGALLFYLGLDLLLQWVYQAAFKFPLWDYGIILLILIIINTVGFLQGVLVGIALSLLLFVIQYSQVNIIRPDCSLSPSTPPQNTSLLELEESVTNHLYYLPLQGFIFFATANQLLDTVQHEVMAARPHPLRFILLDFQHVTGIDSSTVLNLSKIKKIAANHQIILGFIGLNIQVKALLIRGQILEENNSRIKEFSDLKSGLTWCTSCSPLPKGG